MNRGPDPKETLSTLNASSGKAGLLNLNFRSWKHPLSCHSTWGCWHFWTTSLQVSENPGCQAAPPVPVGSQEIGRAIWRLQWKRSSLFLKRTWCRRRTLFLAKVSGDWHFLLRSAGGVTIHFESSLSAGETCCNSSPFSAQAWALSLFFSNHGEQENRHTRNNCESDRDQMVAIGMGRRVLSLGFTLKHSNSWNVSKCHPCRFPPTPPL